MDTQCKQQSFGFHRLGRRQVKARFDGGHISSDAGALLLRRLDDKIGFLDRLAECFRDYRDPDRTEHSVRELIKQRVLGIALGYEDLNDHDELRRDPLLAAVVGKSDPGGEERARERDRGKALAAPSTLNRLELTPASGAAEQRYKKIATDPEAIDRLFVETFVCSKPTPPRRIILDLDATDDPLHGRQEGRFFHGYYDCYCYLPLYIFAGEQLLCARLRPSRIDAAAGATDEVARIVEQIREHWPGVEIWLRADSGFCREELMRWCEENDVEYVFGLAKNPRLLAAIEGELEDLRQQVEQNHQPLRRFVEFRYQTRDSWSRERRVVAKAEYLAAGPNPRFVVTSLSAEQVQAQRLYEEIYCARGEMENHIKEQQLELFADRTSTAYLRSNQLRVWFSSAAYVLLEALRRLGLAGTRLARAQCGTLRLRMLKIGAQVKLTARKVWVSMASGYPWGPEFAAAYRRLGSGVSPGG